MIIEILGEITPNLTNQIREKLTNLKDGENVEVWINSEGGDVFTAFDVVNLLAQIPNTKAIITGLCASAGSIIAFGCNSIEMYENSYLMIHRASCGLYGNCKEIAKEVELLAKVDSTIIDGYRRFLKDSTYDIEGALDNETWFNSHEASNVFNISIRNGVPRNASLRISNVLNHNYKNVPQQLIDNSKQTNITDEVDYDLIAEKVLKALDKREEERKAKEKEDERKAKEQEMLNRILKNLEKEN